MTGDLYDAEHGPRGGDELNLVLPGRNYGWPVITYGMNYDGSPITGLTAKEGMEQPVVHWTPSIAVCAHRLLRGRPLPALEERPARVVARGRGAAPPRRSRAARSTKQEVLFKGIGRVRDVVSGPDGLVYVAFNDPDRVARLVPAAP